MLRTILAIILLFAFQTSAANCELGDIKFDNRFAAASSDKMIRSCHINDKGNVITFILQPENVPINDSPWYAFKLSSKQSKKVKIILKVKEGNNRYPPKISRNGKNWQAIKHSFDGDKLTFKVNLSQQPLWIAGQEIITNEDYIKWQNKLIETSFISLKEIGRSVEQRPIFALEIKQNPNAKEWLVILGRQHPPELTGAMALFPFAANLLSSSELAQVFRNRYNILIVPNMNPDGVELGHWRHNMNGVDLNRDWKVFAQPEVKAVHEHIQKIVNQGGKMAMAVDFHSTKRDIFYTMPNDYGVEQKYLVNNWLNKLDKQYADFNIIQKPGNNPDRGVFKQYFADQYKVHAITYEMGDNTDRAFIHELAIKAGNDLMKTMLMDNQALRD